jgi:hypothetical protein
MVDLILNRSITCALVINQYFSGILGKVNSLMPVKYDLLGRGNLKERITNAKARMTNEVQSTNDKDGGKQRESPSSLRQAQDRL